MAAISVDTATERVKATAHRAVAAAAEQAAALAEEARTLKTRAAEAAEDYGRTVRRETGRAIRRVEDARDHAAGRIRRAPLTSVALASMAGALAGFAAAWLIVTLGTRRQRDD
jgi:ElaB/YqjD/DUF883 family membrane-anchored ribosome-binding protein